MSTKLPDVVTRYFERDADRDIDSIVSLFADDATVVDEGETRHGSTEIRAWQTGVASKYTYTTEITSTQALGPDRYVVIGRLTGNFPGGVADLKWDFTVAGHHITQLVIAPWPHTGVEPRTSERARATGTPSTGPLTRQSTRRSVRRHAARR
jgi:hypothetical protein